MLECSICSRPRDARYENEAAGEACVDPCHWPYLSAEDVAAASIALDRIRRDGPQAFSPHRAELDAWQVTPSDRDYIPNPHDRWCRVCTKPLADPIHV